MKSLFSKTTESPEINKFIEGLVATLQYNGLSSFSNVDGLKKNYLIYGFEFQERVKRFKEIRDFFKNGIEAKKFAIPYTGFNSRLEDFIIFNLAHHILKCLLNPDQTMPIAYDELEPWKEDCSTYQLPSYDRDKIMAFQLRWKHINNDTQISLDTKDHHEYKLLAKKLANDILEILRCRIDLNDFFSNARKKYEESENIRANKTNKHKENTHDRLFKPRSVKNEKDAKALLDRKRTNERIDIIIAMRRGQ